MTAPATLPVLRKLYNHNNNLLQLYFGNIQEYNSDWKELMGGRYIVQHHELIPFEVEFVGCFLINGYEIEKEMDWKRMSDFCPMTSIRELCGFDEVNFAHWAHATGMTSKNGVGLYVFKNLNH